MWQVPRSHPLPVIDPVGPSGFNGSQSERMSLAEAAAGDRKCLIGPADAEIS